VDKRAQAADARWWGIPKLLETIAACEAECEERRRDLAVLKCKFFELEKKEDALRAGGRRRLKCGGCVKRSLCSRLVCSSLLVYVFIPLMSLHKASAARRSVRCQIGQDTRP
jgi:hypothetical protein